jgi:ankyrin repeat protein
MHAIDGGNPNIVDKLLNIHVDIEHVNTNAETPLFRAILRGNHEIVKALIAKGNTLTTWNAFPTFMTSSS